MVCIYCSAATRVTNSRLQRKANQIWRRRLCSVCGNTFTTHEIVEFGSSIMVRHSKRSLSPFSRDILFTSIYESCKHRASAIADASALTQTIIGQLREYLAEGVLERDIISTVAAATLERYDPTAAAVYGAYHPATTK